MHEARRSCARAWRHQGTKARRHEGTKARRHEDFAEAYREVSRRRDRELRRLHEVARGAAVSRSMVAAGSKAVTLDAERARRGQCEDAHRVSTGHARGVLGGSAVSRGRVATGSLSTSSAQCEDAQRVSTGHSRGHPIRPRAGRFCGLRLVDSRRRARAQREDAQRVSTGHSRGTRPDRVLCGSAVSGAMVAAGSKAVTLDVERGLTRTTSASTPTVFRRVTRGAPERTTLLGGCAVSEGRVATRSLSTSSAPAARGRPPCFDGSRAGHRADHLLGGSAVSREREGCGWFEDRHSRRRARVRAIRVGASFGAPRWPEASAWEAGRPRWVAAARACKFGCSRFRGRVASSVREPSDEQGVAAALRGS